jgi:iron complex transport system ATP-binding protein
MHTHEHTDGTVHNHYHRHPCGRQAHEHNIKGAQEHIHYGGEQTHIHSDEDAYAFRHYAKSEHAHDYDALPTPPTHLHAHNKIKREIICVKDLEYSYRNATKPAFSSINFSAKSGEMLAILGNNGAGKSTLLNILAGTHKPTKGEVILEGHKLHNLSRRELSRHVACVSQQQHDVHLSVYDQVLLGRRPYVSWALSNYDKTVVAATIARLGLESFATRYTDELSGGERQKTYIARALAQEPEVLLLDEPTSALDMKNQIEVLQLISTETKQSNLVTILVIHDVSLALRYCDSFILMNDGKVVSQGSINDLSERDLSMAYGINVQIAQLNGNRVAISG